MFVNFISGKSYHSVVWHIETASPRLSLTLPLVYSQLYEYANILSLVQCASRWLRETVVNKLWEGWPSTACSETVILHEDRRITVHELAQGLNISVDSAFTILYDNLQMQRALCRWVLCFLTPEQMAHSVAAYTELHTLLGGGGCGKEEEAELHNVEMVDEYRMFITIWNQSNRSVLPDVWKFSCKYEFF